MQAALEDAQRTITEIDYINAHATALRLATSRRLKRFEQCSIITVVSYRQCHQEFNRAYSRRERRHRRGRYRFVHSR